MAAVRHLEMRKLQFWSRDLYRHVVLHFCSKLRVDRCDPNRLKGYGAVGVENGLFLLL